MKVYGLPRNPADVVERPRVRRAAKINVLRAEEALAAQALLAPDLLHPLAVQRETFAQQVAVGTA